MFSLPLYEVFISILKPAEENILSISAFPLLTTPFKILYFSPVFTFFLYILNLFLYAPFIVFPGVTPSASTSIICPLHSNAKIAVPFANTVLFILTVSSKVGKCEKSAVPT